MNKLGKTLITLMLLAVTALLPLSGYAVPVPAADMPPCDMSLDTQNDIEGKDCGQLQCDDCLTCHGCSHCAGAAILAGDVTASSPLLAPSFARLSVRLRILFLPSDAPPPRRG